MMTDYILSPCSLAARGLSQLMVNAAKRIVVFLPDDPLWMLTTLRQAARLLDQALQPLPMLILSRSPAIWLWQTLLYQVSHPDRLRNVHTAPADLSCTELADRLENAPRLERLASEAALLNDKRAAGLSHAEFKVILALLQGQTIGEQARRLRLSQKTLYTQRLAGVKKLVEYHPHLAPRFPRTLLPRSSASSLSAFEQEWVQAIHDRQVFPVFQPIVDSRSQLQGVEILIRWRHRGQVLHPQAFLPQFRADYAWLLLTAFVLQEAVQNINEHPGTFYFSVNIPSSLAASDSLLRMVEAARQQLRQPEGVERLVLEYAETIDFRRQSRSTAQVEELQRAGVRVMLDDCFSQGSVIFPARRLHFNAYKLDMSIVNDAQHDQKALALIKSLAYYCQLSGSRCVAEGVDSLAKFTQLKSLGIDRFQGYLFSPPMRREHLPDLIRRFSHQRDPADR
ncbi:cyclic diguanylate phosphodiesterase [Klebsiella variicola]|uniref:cyclic diguanylate phosphodiesterase n=1 Tax=Klebsiella variicola TaxID=244366 RepID=UPI002A4FF288|nr:EAL domain-containing protein [Klebsiella variicola]